jgi:hypothetical protein
MTQSQRNHSISFCSTFLKQLLDWPPATLIHLTVVSATLKSLKRMNFSINWLLWVRVRSVIKLKQKYRAPKNYSQVHHKT